MKTSVVLSALCLLGTTLSGAEATPPPASPAAQVTTNRDWRGAAPLHGLRCLSDTPFPAVAGARTIPVPGGDLESAIGKPPAGWDGALVTSEDAPQGKSYIRLEAKEGAHLHSARIGVEEEQAYFLTFRLKSPGEHWANLSFSGDQRLSTFTDEFFDVPGTGGKWQYVGLYFRVPSSAKTVQLNVVPRKEPEQPGEFICVDDLQLRTASAAEMSAAYAEERAHYPAYEGVRRPNDGANLALSMAKWEGRAGEPDKPFVIWAIGSSWTGAMKNGYGLIDAIRRKFPHAPRIIYRERDGAGTPWDYDAGWVKQFVASEQPDLIFTYTVGTEEGMERLLSEIRRFTTADIIIPSVHYSAPEKTAQLADKAIEHGYVSWQRIRELCEKYHAEFVEHRQDLVDYMQRNHFEPDDLLWDHVHQNELGRMLVWEDIARHLTAPKTPAYQPGALEKTVALTAANGVTTTGHWSTVKNALRSDQAGDRVAIKFTGNRIDLIAHPLAGGGAVDVLIDGRPASETPAFRSDYIKAIAKIWPKPWVGGQAGDVAPHAVTLGANTIPQSWTITMTDDVGNFRLAGSITGPDGEGNATKAFRSTSGQISLDPRDWRNATVKNNNNRIGNGVDDRFEFSTWRSTEPTVKLGGGNASEPLVTTLASNLENVEHTLELVTRDGPVQLDAFYVFTPMLK